MDLFFANSIVILFYVLFITFVEKRNIISAQPSAIKAVGVVLSVLIALLVISLLFALLIGALLPEFYPKVFLYKAIFVTVFLFLYWPFKMIKAQINRVST